MNRSLHQDPDRRCKPLAEWPEADRRLWEAAVVPGDLLAEGSSRAKYTESTNGASVNSYGRWLQWADRRGPLDQTNSPADRITPDLVRPYLADLERHNATQTVINRLVHLSVAAKVMDPDRDWSWIRRLGGRSRRGTGQRDPSVCDWLRPQSCLTSVSA
jgi:integrase/recombinase XerD